MESQDKWRIRALQDLMEGQGDSVGPREDEVRGYLAAVTVQMVAEDPHETDAELHELQLTIDHKVPRKRLAEARYPHTEIRCLGGEWTEGGRQHVVVVIGIRHIRSFAVTFRCDAVSAIIE